MPRIVTPNGHVIDAKTIRDALEEIREVHQISVELFGEDDDKTRRLRGLIEKMVLAIGRDPELAPILQEALSLYA